MSCVINHLCNILGIQVSQVPNLRNLYKEKKTKANYALGFYLNQNPIGPQPIQLVVLMAVRNAVSAATSTFTAISVMVFLFIR
jgi:hypothetical protein